MRFAVYIPNYSTYDGDEGGFSDPHYVAELAVEAEEAGWDGFFIWDHIGANYPAAFADPWQLLAVVALNTTFLKLGPLVTPIPRRRPWKLARETVTLDRLSRGRLILGVGIGGGNEYATFHEPGDVREHGDMLDEGLQVLQGLWSGEPFSYEGSYYQVTGAHFTPKPVQARIPVWVAGMWPNKKPFRRAANWDGVFPIGKGLPFTQQMPPEDVRAVADYVSAQRRNLSKADGPYDLVHWGISTGDGSAAEEKLVACYAQAGVTWWMENLNNRRGSLEEQRERIRRGPPRLS